MQVISSLLNLQSGYLKDDQALEVLKKTQNRVKSMVLIHQILYKTKDPARIDFAEHIRSLVGHLFRSFGVNPEVIKLRLNMGDALLGVDTAIPCGLIVNELVSNSLKYGFPAGKPGEIRLDLRSAPEHRFRLIVSDNGLGLPENLDFRSSPSLGLRLVNKLADQLEGTLKVDRSDGTRFMVEFAELKYRERR